MAKNPIDYSDSSVSPGFGSNINLQLLVSAFQNLQDGVLIFDAKRNPVFVNQAFLQMFGFKHEGEVEHLLRGDASHISFTDGYGIPLVHKNHPIQRILRKETYQDELLRISIHGEKTEWHGRFSGLRLKNAGKASYGMLQVRNASDYQAMEASMGKLLNQSNEVSNDLNAYQNKLDQEKELFQTVINTIPVMITIYNPDIKGFFFNKAVEDITGWTNDDTKQTSIMELAYPDPVYRQEVSAYMQSLQSGFKDIVMRTKDGRDIETSWANISIPDGRQVGIGIDITERKKSLQELKDSEEKFRNLADNISQFAWMADKNGWIFWYNQRWYNYTGTTLKDVEGWGWIKTHHPDHVNRVTKNIQKSFENGTPWEDIFPLRSKNGEYRWFLSRALPIKDKSGEIVRWFGTNTDITNRKNLEEQLQQAKDKAEKAVSVQTAFIQNVSHEIRTPMNSILGFTELLQRKVKVGNERLYLDAIKYNGHQLLRLINDIVDLSRLDKNQLSLSRKQIYLREIINQSKQQFEGLKLTMKKENLQFKLNVPDVYENIIVDTDPERLQQIITNFITNAVKYTEHGFIELGYNVDNEHQVVTLYVKDTGKGIAKENHHRVFRRFQQFDKEKNKLYGGTGLGLAICKHLVRLLGGEVWFESQPGKGSTFYFTHPFTMEKDVHVSDVFKETNTDTAPDLTGKTILVAEDEEFSFIMLKAMLDDTHAEIVHASDGLSAVEIFRKRKVDFIFSDIRLPGLNGYEVIENIRRINKEITAVALTANAMAEEKEKSLQAGFNVHATKPISISDLYGLLHRYFRKN